ncbi:Biotin carboxylase [Achromobacter denitrificans]|uniref:Biotin carboxylase n=1 Tax=Achromobacter denitrificans TaxID=32002 RepID=A0A6N0JGH6_ACHDE|nr:MULTISPECIES: acetyl-CoA carboxylase biotin carboxylase subunit [Achromobacter]ASC66408.1 acetyl-CoA carboxylase biotin carboxylase subunit [Achromobacter denitrificans]MPT38211.1 acetyl-CoA carboxylase biotin carboxylase subunit [Achromobacter sp.]OLU08277.1 acetyl-CoA carboxylase biotin carboxylase subunit [Achromobacter denitrificans]QKH42552.1 acetyl-CoA carboxylase biotin carboxylase subunit [Achromobacter denitrificans]QKH50305.1 acetyl-CoA carboxylase biotin carboxylase subunit [Achr
MFGSVLIANRGEIALRILRACKALGLRTVAVHSEADSGLRHVALADQALCIGPATSRDSYLDIDRLLTAARLTGAQAIHPGYGFLSENAGFAAAVREAGLHFIGPSPEVMALMGDKISAKAAMMKSGIPCVPGFDQALPQDPAELERIAQAIGYPLILKAAAGGGGRGMRVVRAPGELGQAAQLTREEAGRFFGKEDIYLEKFLEHPRHIEIQVLADAHGQAVWLGERDCSIQRRNQKLLEEAPAVGIARPRIVELGEMCARACIDIGYQGVGTFEFLYEKEAFYFMEMNTRIQVEHPVTEMLTGVDLVEQQIRVAMGQGLGFGQKDVRQVGHAIECRINAEDPWNFVPMPGRVETWVAPGGPGVRVDSHLYPGYEVPAHYDSLIAKLIVHGASREQAIARMRVVLSELSADGLHTNAPLFSALLAHEAFQAGGTDIHCLERLLAAGELKQGGAS